MAVTLICKLLMILDTVAEAMMVRDINLSHYKMAAMSSEVTVVTRTL